eukprot:gene12098-14794_t
MESQPESQPEAILRIVYGSETGTAEDVAFGLYSSLLNQEEESLKCSCSVSVCSTADYSFSQMQQDRFVVFILSTTGEGEFPSSTRAFWSQLL